jgi:uncharacterized protein YbjT (DUF2867 family)
MIKVGIIGGTGYTGVELLRLLAQHPQVELKVITSRGEAGKQVADMFPNLRGHVSLAFSEPDDVQGSTNVAGGTTPGMEEVGPRREQRPRTPGATAKALAACPGRNRRMLLL